MRSRAPNEYGVFDLAAAEPLRPRISKLMPPEGTFLLDRKAYPDLPAYGPWLVDLTMCQAIESFWIRDGRWKNWGYTIHSHLTLQALHHHLRKFNLVELEGRRDPIFFRYFDPVVLLAFLTEVATPEQREAFLRPIEAIAVEDSSARRSVRISGGTA